jgi:hypothetical protein
MGEAFATWKVDDCTQFMLAHLQGEAENARGELVTIKPTDTDSMYEAQNTVRVYLEMIRVIDGFINKGNLAVDILRANDEDAPTD